MTLKTARGTLALLALEDAAPAVLFERLPGASVPLWPDVRSGFMYALQKYDFQSTPVEPVPSPRSRAWLGLGRALLPSRWDSRTLRSRRSAMYLVGGGTTHPVDGKRRNWLIGSYTDQFPESSAVLQWKAIGDQPPAFGLTRSLDPLSTRAAAYARLARTRTSSGEVRRHVAEFARLLDDRITSGDIDAITASAHYSASIARHLESQFSRLLDRVDPRVVLMEDASYGGRSALVALMKSRGIHVVEPQHGWIGPTHGAYNFGAAMRAPELFATLPDEVLTFGEYWSAGTRHPAVMTPIGKPHLEAMSALAPRWDDRAREVLLVSSVASPEEATDFALALRAALPAEWAVRFRPHPIERPTLDARYGRMLAQPGIVLDDHGDVYESLALARGVVGVASTVLFEALAMGCRVFVRDSPYADYYVGDLFGSTINGAADVDRVVRGLVGDRPPVVGAAVDAIWRPGAIEAFRSWALGRIVPE